MTASIQKKKKQLNVIVRFYKAFKSLLPLSCRDIRCLKIIANPHCKSYRCSLSEWPTLCKQYGVQSWRQRSIKRHSCSWNQSRQSQVRCLLFFYPRQERLESVALFFEQVLLFTYLMIARLKYFSSHVSYRNSKICMLTGNEVMDMPSVSQ